MAYLMCGLTQLANHLEEYKLESHLPIHENVLKT